MNYLAHLYLATDSPASILGNFLGDFLKGIDINCYNEDIKKGIEQHRKVDVFTDKHPIFKQSKQLISSNNKRYSGIIIDIFYDHFLAKNWWYYSDTSLNEFAAKTYKVLEDNSAILPPRLQAVLPRIKTDNWLICYENIAGISTALKRVSLRIKRENAVAAAIEDLELNYQQFEDHFSKFFPELIAYAQIIIAEQ